VQDSDKRVDIALVLPEPMLLFYLNHLLSILYLSIYINGRTDVCLSVCWYVEALWNPCTDLDEILHSHPHLSKEVFGQGLTLAPSPLGLGGLETLKGEGHIFKMLSRL